MADGEGPDSASGHTSGFMSTRSPRVDDLRDPVVEATKFAVERDGTHLLDDRLERVLASEAMPRSGQKTRPICIGSMST